MTPDDFDLDKLLSIITIRSHELVDDVTVDYKYVEGFWDCAHLVINYFNDLKKGCKDNYD